MMVKGCLLCKKPFGRYPNLSFHIFPNKEDLRKKWFQSIGKEYDKRKYIYICSDHFAEEDFIDTLSGNRHINKNAIPKLVFPTDNNYKITCENYPKSFTVERSSQNIVKTEFDCNSAELPIAWKIESLDDYASLDETNIYEHTKQLYHEHNYNNAVSSLPDDTPIPFESSESNVKDLTFLQVENDKNPSSPADDISETDSYHFTQQKRKNTVNPENIVNSNTNMSVIAGPIRNLAAAKSKIDKQRNKIRALQRNVKRLNVKVNTLNLLFKYLRDNGLVTDMGHNVMQAFVKK